MSWWAETRCLPVVLPWPKGDAHETFPLYEGEIFVGVPLKTPLNKGGKKPKAQGGVSVAATPSTSYRDIPLAIPREIAVPLRTGNIFILGGAARGHEWLP